MLHRGQYNKTPSTPVSRKKGTPSFGPSPRLDRPGALMPMSRRVFKPFIARIHGIGKVTSPRPCQQLSGPPRPASAVQPLPLSRLSCTACPALPAEDLATPRHAPPRLGWTAMLALPVTSSLICIDSPGHVEISHGMAGLIQRQRQRP